VFDNALVRLVAPQLLDALVAAAVIAEKSVTHRIFFVKVLVIGLGWIKIGSVFNSCYDGFFKSARAVMSAKKHRVMRWWTGIPRS